MWKAQDEEIREIWPADFLTIIVTKIKLISFQNLSCYYWTRSQPPTLEPFKINLSSQCFALSIADPYDSRKPLCTCI